MSRTVELIYRDGVFRPVGPVELPEDTHITLTIPEANGSPPSPDGSDADDEPTWWRGVLPVEFEERVVSRIMVEIPKDAPRLEPEPTLDPRWFEEDDSDG